MTRPEAADALTPCGICGGPTDPLYRGHAIPVRASELVPTAHHAGRYGDLYKCQHCGTVQQPSLPTGEDLRDLYREMGDDAYLDEEPGRRATANRLLDLVEEHRPLGRLLDVGCGHGLLLDEARARGAKAFGVEIAERSARFAREDLGLTIVESIDELVALGHDEFDTIVLADVIEHLDDPTAALDRLERLLASNGIMCVVTPDPSSAVARLAGKRWWGYLRAHTYVIPRLTLKELLSAHGLVVSTDLPLKRSFSLRYWLEGLNQRGVAFSRFVQIIEPRIRRDRVVSLSLHDERIVLAHKAPVQQPEKQLFVDRGAATKVHVVLPAYNAAPTIPSVVEEMPRGVADRALLVDDASKDDTSAVALDAGMDVLRHPANRGYGANQKSCYVRAALDGADIVVMVHADNQYDPALVPEMIRPIEEGRADVVLGSRLLRDAAIAGGMPRWKWIGNIFLTAIENVAFKQRLSEYHTGYRAFSVAFLREVAFLRNDDGFVFDQEIFAQIFARRARVTEIPIPTRYFLEASTVSFRKSVVYGLGTLLVLARYRLDARWPWLLLRPPATRLEPFARKRQDEDVRRPRTGKAEIVRSLRTRGRSS